MLQFMWDVQWSRQVIRGWPIFLNMAAKSFSIELLVVSRESSEHMVAILPEH